MLWRMSADLHDPRLGSMAFIGCLRPVTNVSATSVFRRPKATALTALTAPTPAAAPFRAANDRHASAKTTAALPEIPEIPEIQTGKTARGLLQELQVLPHEIAADALGIGVDKLPGDRTRRLAVGDRAAVEALDRQDAEAGRGQEHFLGIGRVE